MEYLKLVNLDKKAEHFFCRAERRRKTEAFNSAPACSASQPSAAGMNLPL